MKDDNRSNTSTQDDTLSPVSDLIGATDRVLDRVYKNASQIVNNYSDYWSDPIDESTSYNIPGFMRDRANEYLDKAAAYYNGNTEPQDRNTDNESRRHRPWGHGNCHWRKPRNRQIKGDVFQIEGPGVPETKDRYGNGISTFSDNGAQFINLDRSKPKDLQASPVPSGAQYEKCKGLDGTSVWTKEGVWRCLFPASNSDQRALDAALVKTKINSPNYFATKDGKITTTAMGNSSNEKILTSAQVFPDFGTYLDWKSGVRNALRENYFHSRTMEKPSGVNRIHDARHDTPKTAPVSNVSEQDTKHGSFDQDLKNQSKKVTSTSFITSTITKEDGSLETKEIMKKWYSDGTTSTTENIKNSRVPEHERESSGWFWK